MEGERTRNDAKQERALTWHSALLPQVTDMGALGLITQSSQAPSDSLSGQTM